MRSNNDADGGAAPNPLIPYFINIIITIIMPDYYFTNRISMDIGIIMS